MAIVLIAAGVVGRNRRWMDRRGLVIQQRSFATGFATTSRHFATMSGWRNASVRNGGNGANGPNNVRRRRRVGLLVADVADYPAWQRPYHALDIAAPTSQSTQEGTMAEEEWRP